MIEGMLEVAVADLPCCSRSGQRVRLTDRG